MARRREVKRRCARCQEEKPPADFPGLAGGVDGVDLKAWCQTCDRVLTRRWRRAQKAAESRPTTRRAASR